MGGVLDVVWSDGSFFVCWVGGSGFITEISIMCDLENVNNLYAVN